MHKCREIHFAIPKRGILGQILHCYFYVTILGTMFSLHPYVTLKPPSGSFFYSFPIYKTNILWKIPILLGRCINLLDYWYETMLPNLLLPCHEWKEFFMPFSFISQFLMASTASCATSKLYDLQRL